MSVSTYIPLYICPDNSAVCVSLLQDSGDDEHSGELGSRSSSNLLSAQLTELSLELSKLLLQIILALSPKGTGLDFGGRLYNNSLASISYEDFTVTMIQSLPLCCGVVWSIW